jgi:hypothetical protein
MIKSYDVSSYNSREELETAIINDFGKTTDKKDAVIVGKISDLYKVQLSHGQSVWGVMVESTDFISSPVVDKPQRGAMFKSNLNYTQDETN